ncbi:hypothetical protein H0Z09_18385 [Pseudomonas sp. SWRI18]|uniref:hypothetical protein n=1 Tax=Pseudomonas sp. SWRI18 TaxID=2753888 RepID=UPI00164528C0|nr:hypothetical protein [Pseudomonas sp. SWRI18]MBC3303096.1 hypothetical protein [Pseudomonas sp. SWRI18]
MINVSSSTSSSNTRPANDAASVVARRPVSPEDSKNAASISSNRGTSTTVSILALQLSDAATRAAASVEQKSTDPLDPITGEEYFANNTQHDAEIPNTTHPELLARARQATDFLNGHDTNPFNGLGRDQLNLIARDDSGAFTVNERRAAWETMQSMESPTASSSESVSVNGRDIMVSRLFNNREPPVALPPATFENITQRRSEFLTLDDRALIGDMYAYAQSQGADLAYVDRLVMSLSTYRYYSDGRQLSGNNGYDTDGYRVTLDFKPEDAATASSILNGSAINSTRIDQGFLRYILSPDHGSFINIGGIPFLERMVKKFSSEGADQPPLGSEFTTFKRARVEDHVVSTTHKDIRLPPSKAVTQVVNGVWSLTEYGKAEGYRLDKATRQVYKPAEPPTDQAQQRSTWNDPASEARNNSLFQALSDTGEQPKTRWLWPGHLFKLMKNFKP